MNIPLTILAGVCILLGLLGSLMLITLLLAGSPNSTPAQLHTIKLLMLAVAIGGVLCVAGSVTLIVWHRPLWASAVGIAPAATVFCGIVYFSVLSAWR
jgi:hypothetical protein